jgi:hypothetical protein
LPAILAGVTSVLVLVALVFVFKRGKSPADISTASGSGSSASQTSERETPDNQGIAETPQTPFNYSWVDGHDRSGNQKIECNVYELPTFGKPTNLVFEKGKTYNFSARIAAYDPIKNDVLRNWGYAWHIFGTTETLASGKGVLSNSGYAEVKFSIKPSVAGVYRFRVAIGDAADEDAIVFNMPASVSTKQALGI